MTSLEYQCLYLNMQMHHLYYFHIHRHCSKVLDLGIAHDDDEEIHRILDDAFSSGINILLTSGGVSMGDRDFVKPLLGKRGTLHFSKVLVHMLSGLDLLLPIRIIIST